MFTHVTYAFGVRRNVFRSKQALMESSKLEHFLRGLDLLQLSPDWKATVQYNIIPVHVLMERRGHGKGQRALLSIAPVSFSVHRSLCFSLVLIPPRYTGTTSRYSASVERVFTCESRVASGNQPTIYRFFVVKLSSNDKLTIY